MNKWSHLGLVVIAAIVLSACSQNTPTATSQPTEEVSEFRVQDYDLEIDSASLSKEYYSAGYALDAESGESLLIVKVKMLPGDVSEEVLSWDVTADADDNKGLESIGRELQSSEDTEFDVVTWIFRVPETATTFVLNFPDSNMIDISSVVSTVP